MDSDFNILPFLPHKNRRHDPVSPGSLLGRRLISRKAVRIEMGFEQPGNRLRALRFEVQGKRKICKLGIMVIAIHPAIVGQDEIQRRIVIVDHGPIAPDHVEGSVAPPEFNQQVGGSFFFSF